MFVLCSRKCKEGKVELEIIQWSGKGNVVGSGLAGKLGVKPQPLLGEYKEG